MIRNPIAAALICLSSLHAFSLKLSAQTPENDFFSNAIVLTGNSVSTNGTNVNATKEAGEPRHADNEGGKSVWWTWTATESGYVTISTEGSTSTDDFEMDTLLGVYIGTAVNSSGYVASNDDDTGTLTSRVFFYATAGRTYRIAVDGYAFDPGSADSGTISLSLNFTQGLAYKTAPAWSLLDINGQRTSSTNFAGKVVLLNFWATWCPPCVEETPDLVALHNQYEADGFTVIGVSIDDDGTGRPPEALVRAFVQNFQMNYPVVYSRPDGSVENEYGIFFYPTTFVIDRENNIVAEEIGLRSKDYYEQMIKRLLYRNLRTTTHHTPTGLQISWPTTQAGFVLESTDNLQNPVWEPVNAPIQSEGTNKVVTISRETPARFFRLRME